VWDLHYTPLPRKSPTFGINAVPFNTPPDYTSPWVVPGTYTVKLTAGGTSSTQPLVVRMDPRVKTPAEGLAQQLAMSMQMVDDLRRVNASLEEFGTLQSKARNAKYEEIAGVAEEDDENPSPRSKDGPDTLTTVAASLKTLFDSLQSADVAPTTQTAAAVADEHRAAEAIMKRWEGR
jgi:hypothetical protein